MDFSLPALITRGHLAYQSLTQTRHPTNPCKSVVSRCHSQRWDPLSRSGCVCLPCSRRLGLPTITAWSLWFRNPQSCTSIIIHLEISWVDTVSAFCFDGSLKRVDWGKSQSIGSNQFGELLQFTQKARGFWHKLNLAMRKHSTHVKFLKMCVDTIMLLVQEKPLFGQMFSVTFGVLVASRALKFDRSSVPETTSFLSKRKKKGSFTMISWLTS